MSTQVPSCKDTNATRVDTAVEQSQTLVSLMATNFSQKYYICNPECLKEFVVLSR